MNAEVNSGNSSTSNYTLQLRIRECHAGMKCDLKVTKHYSHCVDPEYTHFVATVNFQWEINPGGGGALPYISYIGMCRPKGYGF